MKVLIIAEYKEDSILPITFSMINYFNSLNASLDIFIYGNNLNEKLNVLKTLKVNKIYSLDNSSLSIENEYLISNILYDFIKRQEYDLIVSSNNLLKKGILSYLSSKLDQVYIPDLKEITLKEDEFFLSRYSYGGNIKTTFKVVKEYLGFISFVDEFYNTNIEKSGNEAEVITLNIEELSSSKVELIESKKLEFEGVNIQDADIIVGVGRGIKSKENLEIIYQLANLLSAAVGATRAIVHEGWIDYYHQIGQTGHTLSPKLYIAIGLSGAPQHIIGIKNSNYILAINKDPEAPIFKISNYAVIDDLFEVVPLVIDKLKERKEVSSGV